MSDGDLTDVVVAVSRPVTSVGSNECTTIAMDIIIDIAIVINAIHITWINMHEHGCLGNIPSVSTPDILKSVRTSVST